MGLSVNPSKKRIAKNALYLYLRMFVVMAVSIYTSRVILRTLGAEDYGIYNVVGGIMGIIGFINGALASSTSRFLTFEIGRGKDGLLDKTFSVSLNLHIIVALLILFIAETVGLWLFYEKLVIPEERMHAAFWVYQFSIISAMLTFIQIPYNASLIAHENFSIYAYVGLYSAFANLIIAYLIQISPIDRLVFYALLLMINVFVVQLFYRYYTYTRYAECRFRLIKDGYLYKRQLSYSGWGLFGGLASVSQGQGINILLNLFFGPMVNAARAIAYQIQGAATSFVNGFLSAVRPQVIKKYAEDDVEGMYDLTFQTARCAFYLMLALVLPLCFELRFVLDLWLGDAYPEETYLFSLIVLIFAQTEILREVLNMPFHAIGKMRLGNSLNGTIMIMALPISYFVLKLGCPSYSVFIVLVVINLIVTFNGWLIVYSYEHFSVRTFMTDVVARCVFVCAVSVITPSVIRYLMEDGWARFITTCVMSEFSLFGIVYFFGLKSHERSMMIGVITEKILKRHLK